jgi:hypothetical protein
MRPDTGTIPSAGLVFSTLSTGKEDVSAPSLRRQQSTTVVATGIVKQYSDT